MHHGVDEVHIQRVHVVDPPGGLLEGCETHVEVHLVQVTTVKRIQLEGEKGPMVIHGCVCDKHGLFVPVCVWFFEPYLSSCICDVLQSPFQVSQSLLGDSNTGKPSAIHIIRTTRYE